MNTESFVMYESVYKQFITLKNRVGSDVANDFIQAIMEFGLYGVMPDEDSEIMLYGLEQIITSIYHAQKKRNKGGRPKKEFDLDAAKQRMAEGQSLKDTAKEFGISEDTLYRRLNEDAKPQNNVNEKVKVKEKEKGNTECMNDNGSSVQSYYGESIF